MGGANTRHVNKDGTNFGLLGNSAFHCFKMRIRITQPLSGSIDGIQLSRFVTGVVYEVGTTLGSYLLSIGAAEPVDMDSPAIVVPIKDVVRILKHAKPVSEAADRPRRKRTQTRPRKRR